MFLSKEQKRRLKRDWDETSPAVKRSLACLVVLVFYACLFASPLGRSLELEARHLSFRLRGDRPRPADVVIVRLDEFAYSKVGIPVGDKFPRARLAEGLEKIASFKPKLVFLDVTADSVGADLQADAQLARALSLVPTVMGRADEEVIDYDVNQNPIRRRFVKKPLPLFAANLAAAIPLILRNIDLLVEEIVLNNPVAMLSDVRVPLYGPLKKYVAPEIKEPGDYDLINYYGDKRSFTSISFAEVLGDSYVDPSYFAGKFVAIGSTAASGVSAHKMADTFLTPLSGRYVFGVQIHATIAANLLDGTFLRRGSPDQEFGGTLLVMLFAAYLLFSLRFSRAWIASGLIALVIATVSFTAFAKFCVILPCGSLVVAILLICPARYVWSEFRKWARKQQALRKERAEAIARSVQSLEI